MSPENIEIVRTALEALHSNDSEAFARHLDPEFEFRSPYGPERGVYRGLEPTVEVFDRWQTAFSDYGWKPTDYVEAGADCVIVRFVEGGLGRASGVETDQRGAYVCDLRAGRILRITEYRTEAEALEAAGLRG
jgi:ketosteroid isomerase-like protein